MNPLVWLREIFRLPAYIRCACEAVADSRELALVEQLRSIYRCSPNPVARCGAQCFSQSDEDGITLEIVRRLSLANGTFAELGVGDGLENNTILLRSLGWRGFWLGGQPLAFSVPADCEGFRFEREWITRENVTGLVLRMQRSLGMQTLDVLSLDLDGNDFHILRELLRNSILPEVVICEYNALFPPPIKFVMPYQANHTWQGDANFGASLASFSEMLGSFGYSLVCCNLATGCNAFFVKEAHNRSFDDVPQDIGTKFVPPRYILARGSRHRVTPELVAGIVRGNTRRHELTGVR